MCLHNRCYTLSAVDAASEQYVSAAVYCVAYSWPLRANMTPSTDLEGLHNVGLTAEPRHYRR